MWGSYHNLQLFDTFLLYQNYFEVCFGSLSLLESEQLSRQPQSCLNGMSLKYMLWQPFWLKMPQIQNRINNLVNSKTSLDHYTIPPPYFTVGTTHAALMHSPTLHLKKALQCGPNLSNLESSVHQMDFYSSDIQFLCFFAQGIFGVIY